MRTPSRHEGHLRLHRAEHPAQFAEAAVHFTVTAQVTGDLDIVRGARRLLNADVAVSAAWPSESTIRVGKRLRPLARSLARARGLWEGYVQADADGGWRAGLAFAFRHPRYGLMHLRGLWAPRVVADLDRLVTRSTVPALLLFLAKHPIVGVHRILPIVRFHRGEAPNPPPSVAEMALGTREPSPGDSETDDDPMGPLDEAERVILEQQAISAFEREIDARLFGGRDRDEDRFVRLQLRNTYHDFTVPGADRVEHVVFEPRLLMHESGVVQLDLRLSLEAPLTTSGVVDLTSGFEPRISRSEISTPLIAGGRWAGRVSAVSDAVDAGKPLLVVEHESPVSMTEALGAHLDAVMHVLGLRYGSWVNYPVAFVKPGKCCGRRRWRKSHAGDVHRLVLRAGGSARIADHVDPPRDLSLRADHSLFATIGSALYVQWGGEARAAIDELYTVLIAEYAMLLYMRLQTMETEVSRLRLGDRQLRRRFRDAILLFSELRQGNLRAGEARDIAGHILAEHRAEQIRGTIDSALNLAAMAHSTVSASRASRRSWWITLLATLIAALVAVPPIRQLLDTVNPAPANGGPQWFVDILRWAAGLDFWGPWVLLGIVFALVATLMTLGWIWRHRLRRWPSVRRGFAWPTQFTFEPPGSEDGARSGASAD